ncbi:MAG: hypothetical protein A3G91_02135 [Omnitrophica WOR_2 bacterium RIFCSPLOWO2_12_FULL_50_9]|nr:MAG: hypothetical protein A3D87_08060 [Omnitrophica WOR_2 bacterium RIFCSPHIGHO2_02_FULL_50_17]OGX43608.1 MAG: hypothetical protein A3G91_02135 [Omnitrophica WOR_2 bacterium RIFCSPLOWO2_12_FULL_50_9]
MVISNLNIKLIEDRLIFINESIIRLKKLSALAQEDFLSGDNTAIAESYLRRSLEAVFDISRHIVAKSASGGVVEYKEIATALGNLGIITKEHSEKLRLMAGYRNRLVHFYHEITDKELYSLIKNHLGDMEIFLKEMKSFLEKYRSAR